jgi:hypothetical protein
MEPKPLRRPPPKLLRKTFRVRKPKPPRLSKPSPKPKRRSLKRRPA